MSKNTKNHKLFKYEDNDNADLTFLSDTMDTIDKGLTLDVGTSTGTGNNYILDIGSITLAESNKGISFKFFADKDSTGAVTINTNYNLIKPTKKPVKNLKGGAPYIITYDGGSNFFLASGSDESDSTSVGTDGSNVKVGETFIGTDGEVHTGTFTVDGTMLASDLLSGKVGYSKGNKITGGMTNNGAKTAALNCGGSYIIPTGYHNGSGKVTANSLASQTGATANASKIVSGYTAWVNGAKITGNAIKAEDSGIEISTFRFPYSKDAGNSVLLTLNNTIDCAYILGNTDESKVTTIVENGVVVTSETNAMALEYTYSLSNDKKTLTCRATEDIRNTSSNQRPICVAIHYKA